MNKLCAIAVRFVDKAIKVVKLKNNPQLDAITPQLSPCLGEPQATGAERFSFLSRVSPPSISYY